ncbi:hypothetical protein AYO38_00655 [bacterium SCGC AG-212-C10]|nr:hypothetical protein AYO38_00655 [bacterium SCGC AG-212-C10]
MTEDSASDVLVSVVIPVLNDHRILACVESILESAALAGVLHEVIVVDNGSTADFSATLAKLPDQVLVVTEPKRGMHTARNTGLRHSRGEFILSADADVVVARDWVSQALAGFEATGADVLAGVPMSTGTLPAQRTIELGQQRNLGRASVRARGPTFFDTKDGAFRRNVFDRCQFDERLLRAMGDIQFGFDAQAAGFTLAWWPAMTVDHAHEDRLAVLVAKAFGVGWGYHFVAGCHPEMLARVPFLARVGPIEDLAGRFPWLRRLALPMAKAGYFGAATIDRLPASVSPRIRIALLRPCSRLAIVGGVFWALAGKPEPSVADVTGRPHPRN